MKNSPAEAAFCRLCYIGIYFFASRIAAQFKKKKNESLAEFQETV